MATSTAPITLPVQHRARRRRPQTRTVLAALAAAARRPFGEVRYLTVELGVGHVIGMGLVIALLVAVPYLAAFGMQP